MTEKKKPIDWEAIETDYRAGIKSLRVMSAEYGVSHVAIKKRADRDGWVRDLSAKIKAATEAKVNSSLVTSEVNSGKRINENAVVEAAAETQKDLILGHRKDIGRARKLAMSLLDELEVVTDNRELFEQLGALLHSPDDNGRDKLSELYHKAISMPGRTGTMKQLSETLKNLVTLEREAFGIETKGPLDGLTDAVKNIGVSFIPAPNRSIA